MRCLELGADDHLPEAVQSGDPARARRLVAREEASARRRAASRAQPRARARDRTRDPARLPAGRRFPQPAGWELRAHFRPARQVAGDFYDAFPLPGGRVAHRPRRRVRQGSRRRAVHGALSQPLSRARRAAVRRRIGAERGAARDGAGHQRLHRAHARPRQHVRHGVLRRARPGVGRDRVRERRPRAAGAARRRRRACGRDSRRPAPPSGSCPSCRSVWRANASGAARRWSPTPTASSTRAIPQRSHIGEERLMALLAARQRDGAGAHRARGLRARRVHRRRARSSTTSRCSPRGGSHDRPARARGASRTDGTARAAWATAASDRPARLSRPRLDVSAVLHPVRRHAVPGPVHEVLLGAAELPPVRVAAPRAGHRVARTQPEARRVHQPADRLGDHRMLPADRRVQPRPVRGRAARHPLGVHQRRRVAHGGAQRARDRLRCARRRHDVRRALRARSGAACSRRGSAWR